jgi:hypothetical protein
VSACPDILVQNHGSLYTVHAMTDAGYSWVESYLAQNEGLQMMGLRRREE